MTDNTLEKPLTELSESYLPAKSLAFRVLESSKVTRPVFSHKRIKALFLPQTKRAFDVIFSLAAIVLLSPLFLVVAILVRLLLGSPVIFSQPRPGKDGKLFKIYKFRSMEEKVDSKGALLSDAERLTSFGKFLRSTSLDELPELFNVLRGEMSFVGPRPLIAEYLPLYSELQMRRHELRPGLTGWAQINGRNLLSWDEKFKFDVWYVDNWDLFLDLKILLLTVQKVLTGEGIQARNHATMPKFKGNK